MTGGMMHLHHCILHVEWLRIKKVEYPLHYDFRAHIYCAHLLSCIAIVCTCIDLCIGTPQALPCHACPSDASIDPLVACAHFSQSQSNCCHKLNLTASPVFDATTTLAYVLRPRSE